MLKNILNHKKKLIVVVLLLALISVSAYVLLNKKSTVKTTTEKTSEVSTKEDKKSEVKNDKNTDKKNETKTSDKKEDVKVDDKKSDTKTEETPTSTENTTSTNISNNTSTTTNNNTSSNSTSNNNVSAPCVPTYTTVNHPAVGHYEQREVMPAYTKGVYEEKIVGGQTGRIYNTLDEWASQDADYSYSVQKVQVGTETVPAEYENVWVEDQPAYTTTEASGC